MYTRVVINELGFLFRIYDHEQTKHGFRSHIDTIAFINLPLASDSKQKLLRLVVVETYIVCFGGGAGGRCRACLVICREVVG